jgi:hypothetical protein
VVEKLGAQRREEALCDGVVPTIARSTHARDDAGVRKCGTVFVARVRTAAIGMVNETSPWMPQSQRLVQSFKGKQRDRWCR